MGGRAGAGGGGGALLSDPGGGGSCGALVGAGRPHPHPHQKNFTPAQNEICSRGRKLEANFRYTNFFWPLSHPVPPGKGGGIFCTSTTSKSVEMLDSLENIKIRNTPGFAASLFLTPNQGLHQYVWSLTTAR